MVGRLADVSSSLCGGTVENATPIVELAKALKTRLDTELSVTFERAYVPFLNREDVEDGKYILMGSSEDTTTRRLVDTDKASIVVAYQKALPDSTTTYPDPLKNNPFLMIACRR